MSLGSINFERLRNPYKDKLQHFTKDYLSNHIYWLKPNHLTLLNLVSFMLSAVILVINQNYIWVCGILLIVAGLSDTFDGILARSRKIDNSKGMFLDGAMDRFGELFLLTGLYISNIVNRELVVVTAIFGLLINYLQLHYIQSGGEFKSTIMEKPERNVFYIAFCLFWSFNSLKSILVWSFYGVVIMQLFSVFQILNRARIHDLSKPTDPFEDTFEDDYTYERREYIAVS